MGDKDSLSIDSNPKELNKYYIIKNFGNYAKAQCEYCLTNKPIGSFQIVKFYVLSEDGLIEAIKDIPKDLCENCYKLLKENEKIPPQLEPLYYMRVRDPIQCLKELDKFPKFSLTNLLIKLFSDNLNASNQEGIVYSDEILLERLKKMSANERANIIYEFLTEKLFDFDILGDLLYIDLRKETLENLYFVRNGKLIEGKNIIASLLMRCFNEIVTTLVLKEVILKLLKNAIFISRDEYRDKVNPIRYLKFKNVILDTVNFEIANNLEYYFTYEIPWEIDLSFFEKLRQGLINEDYFQNCLFYQVLRRFYDDENWNKLILALGSIICYGLAEKRRIFLIIGDPNTGKSTLVSLLMRALGDFAYPMSQLHFKGSYNYPFQFLMYGSRIGIMSEKPELTISNIETLKRVTGDEYLEVHDKHMKAVKVIAMLRIIIYANSDPSFNQYDEAFLWRIVFIDTKDPLQKLDPALLNELKKEENVKDFLKFLLWCGFQYYKKGSIIENPEEYNEYVMRRFKEAGDFLKDFIEEYCEIGEKFEEERGVLYEAFIEFRKERGLPLNISDRTFYRAMRFRYQEVEGDRGYRYFKGIKVKEEYRPKKSLDSQKSLI